MTEAMILIVSASSLVMIVGIAFFVSEHMNKLRAK